MRYHLLLNTFGRMVKIKKTYFPYSEGAYIFFHDCNFSNFVCTFATQKSVTSFKGAATPFPVSLEPLVMEN